MPSNQPRREIGLSLPVKSIEQRGADRLRLGRQIIEGLGAVTWDACRRHIVDPAALEWKAHVRAPIVESENAPAVSPRCGLKSPA
jgi:hypothetical protein